MASLSIVTLLAAVAIYLGVREIQLTHGAETAVFLLVVLFLYFRHHTGTSMSETLSVPFGVLGLGLIWRGIDKRSQTLAAFGLFYHRSRIKYPAGCHVHTSPDIVMDRPTAKKRE